MKHYKIMGTIKTYTIEISEPSDKNQLWGAWCKELAISAFGETENEAFYNLIENIPVYFKIKGDKERVKLLRSKTTKSNKRVFTIPAFA